MAKKKTQKKTREGIRIVNRKGRHDYHILEVLECGIELVGTEVKSLRAGQAKIDEGFARIEAGQLFLVGANIAQYPNAAGDLQHAPNRNRKLLVHRGQIAKLESHVRQKGKTVIPLAMYFKRGWAKCQIALAVGKRQYDKRETIRKRQQQRDIARELSRRRR